MDPEQASLTVDPRIGTELAGYRIEALLGRGGMSVVYRAEDRALRRKVALKVLAPELAEDERFRERFLRESQLAASIDHANVIPIYEAGEAEGLLYIAMRYVEGTDLGSLLEREGPLEPGRVLSILGQVASALDAARFARGLVHRDVKPGNILIASEQGADSPDHVYLSDFGLSKRAADEGSLTEGGQFFGTLDYVAPEQIEGEAVDGRTDVYSLGCVLYECLTGHVPYAKETKTALLWAHLQEPPPTVTVLRPDLPTGIDTVVARALAKSPDERYPTCRELVADARTELKVGTGEYQMLAAANPRGRLRSRRARLLLASAAALVIAAAAAVPSILLTGGGSKAAVTGVLLVRIDPTTNRIAKVIRLDRELVGTLAVGKAAVWVVSPGDATVLQIDPETNTVVRTLGVGGDLADIAVDATEIVWLTQAFGGPVLSVRPFPGGIDTIKRPTKPIYGSLPHIAVGENSVWVSGDGGTVQRIDPSANRLAATTKVGVSSFAPPIAVSATAVWVLGEGKVWRIDPATNRVARVARVPGGTIEAAAGGGAVWAVGCPLPEPLTATPVGFLWRIDSATSKVRSIRVGQCPYAVAFGHGAVWVTDNRTRSVSTVFRIDPTTGKVVASIDVPGGTRDLGVGESGVWVTTAIW